MTETFESIFKTYYPPVKQFAMKLLKNEDDAQDVAQDVFASLWPKEDVWRDNDQVDKYIYRMAKYKTLNLIRRRSLELSYQKTQEQDGFVRDALQHESAHDSVCYEELALMLRMAIDSLPTRRREIFKLSRYEHLSNKEISEMMNISLRTVENHIYAALLELKAVMCSLS